MADFDIKNVRKVTRLAKLNVPAEQEQSLAQELGAVLGMVDQLSEVDTDGIAPLASVASVTLPQRKDIVTMGGIADTIVAGAPDQKQNFFVVPKVVG